MVWVSVPAAGPAWDLTAGSEGLTGLGGPKPRNSNLEGAQLSTRTIVILSLRKGASKAIARTRFSGTQSQSLMLAYLPHTYTESSVLFRKGLHSCQRLVQDLDIVGCC